jgi:HD domain-containing protein
MDLNEMVSPDTPVGRAATQVARRYCSSALYAHSVRSYLWGVAYAQYEGITFDVELFHVAALLHDVGLTRSFDAHEMSFEEAGGQVAWVFGAGAGWSELRRNRVAQVIEKHMWSSVDPTDDVEGHLLEVATGIDISGRGLDLIPTDVQADVVTQWPRMGLAAEFTECLHVQGERKPASRAADLTRAGLAEAMRKHPLEGRKPR